MKKTAEYSDIISLEKLISVYKNIRLTTCHRDKLVKFELFYTSNLISILERLKNKTYRHGKYNLFLISIPKHRIIMSENMNDKIVNHLISKYVLGPTLLPKLIEMNVATREDKGTKMGIYYTKKYINKLKHNNEKVYALKCDINKYFYNIDHQILIEKLRKDLTDVDLINLLENIITSTDEEYVNRGIEKLKMSAIENLKKMNLTDIDKKIAEVNSLPTYRRGVGLPIGNETSQILAIYFLNGLDHFVKEKLGCKCYLRYMDDFILFSPDKEYLKKCLTEITEYIKDLKLTLNRKTQIYDLSKGMNFLGYRFILKDKRLIMLINSQTKKRVKKKLKRLKKRNAPNYSQVLASYNGYFKIADSRNFLFKSKF